MANGESSSPPPYKNAGITMKKAVLLILICLMTSVLHAQEADAHIASLVNNEEWFALAEDLPLYSDSMQADYLRLTDRSVLSSTLDL